VASKARLLKRQGTRRDIAIACDLKAEVEVGCSSRPNRTDNDTSQATAPWYATRPAAGEVQPIG
jgi:hypothetical protein